MDTINLNLVLLLTVGFAVASILGYISYRLKLSPIVGYLLGGYVIGPFSPGFVADLQMAEQLAEIGVILMMFGVGLHFKWQDLMYVGKIAIPGAIGQTLAATTIGALLMYSIGWTLEAGLILGAAVGVASTVVLVRVLTDFNILHTPQGHIAVGWLIVEDIITVAILILVPALSTSASGEEFSIQTTFLSLAYIFIKFIVITTLLFSLGKKIISYVLSTIVSTHSHELFTLSILALTFVIAVGTSMASGTSIALGAFIAGMMLGQTNFHRQVSLNTIPLKDAFVVIFFLSIGMLFNPFAIIDNFFLFIGILFIIIVVKPITAFLITLLFKYPLKTALTLAIALAQIGEFSFILAEEATRYKILPDVGFDLIVACSLVSITINPVLFRLFRL